MVYDCKDKDIKDATDCHYNYPQTVTNQKNPNANPQRIDWKNPENAIGYNTNTVTSSQLTRKIEVTKYKDKVTHDKNGKKVVTKVPDKTKEVYNHPWALASSDFHMEIPSGSYVREIKFEVRMRMTGNKNATVPAPQLNFRVAGSSDHYVSLKTNLSSSFATYTYVMDRTALTNAKVTIDSLNRNQMGADIVFGDATFKGKGEAGKTESVDVQVEWIRCHVEYDTPQHKIWIHNPLDTYVDTTTVVTGTNTVKGVTGSNLTYATVKEKRGTSSNPFLVKHNKSFKLEVHYTNKSQAYGSNPRTVQLSIPQGSRVVSASASSGSYNTDTNEWTFNSKANADYVLYLTLSTTKMGYSHVDATITGFISGKTVTKKSTYYYNCYGADDSSDVIISTVGDIRKGTKSCFQFDITGISGDDDLIVTVSGQGISDGTWTLVDGTDGISLDSQTSTTATLTVPVLTDYTCRLRYCCYPTITPAITISVSTSESDTPVNYTVRVDPAFEYIFIPKGTVEDSSRMVISDHRVASELEFDVSTTVIPCVVDEGDSTMIMSECTLGASVWEDLDYIGCVPLEHLHFDPKSTYKDKLLDSHYKNKRYMGKQLASDEDITLNVRLHPQQVTTIQGLIDMDKPVPINANHRCFEGDALNHRGWAEIYGIKAEKTNEHWYKCDIDVKYLTHNLNTRFKISKGAKVDDYTIPQIMSEVVSSGDNLSESEYFVTDTDGTFYYAEDYTVDTTPVTINDNERNTFSIDNAQHIRITSKDPLTHTSVVDYQWSSTILPEIRENDVVKIVRLINKDGKVYFEYEYDNVRIGDDEVMADVIYRVLEADGSYTDYNERDISFRFNPSDYAGDDDTVTDDDIDDAIETGEPHYGSTFHLELMNNKINFVDMGFNGREVVVNGVQLVEDSYYYQVEWINNNNDAETSDVDCVLDFIVQDTLLTSAYADKFSKLVVSPFPVPKKKVLFTRNGEEGTLYYYYDDGEEFSYLVEPYYQYLNGTDLVTDSGISIFNLNYGYEVVYIQNGLVRLGFNRLNGDIYLGKYDPSIEHYITTQRFHLNKFDDVNLNNISDDVIEVQASDCTFTIYRGHPYIKVKHELESIMIDTTFNQVWAERVGDENSLELPAYWELFNDANLLDPCVSSDLKSSCIDVTEVLVNDRQESSLSWDTVPSNIIVGEEQTFKLSDVVLSEQKDTLYVEGGDCIFGQYSVEFECDNVPTFISSFYVDKDIIQTGEVDDISVRVVDNCYNGVNNVRVDFYELLEPLITLTSNKSIIQSGEKANLSAKVKDEDGSLVDNIRVDFYEVFTPVYALTGDKSIIQSSETMDLSVKVKDTDGSIVAGQKVYFYERYTPIWSISSSKDIIQSSETVDLSVKVTDNDGNLIKGEKVYFYIREETEE